MQFQEKREILSKEKNSPIALILLPSNSLAEQVSNHLKTYIKYMNYINIVHLGEEENSSSSIFEKVDIVIGTTGRLLNELEKNTFSLDKLQMFVVDECDRMLRLGFIPEVKKNI